MTDTQWPRYQVFIQEKEESPFQDAGSVHATDPEMALQNARDVFARRPACVGMWVVPAESIYSRTAQELKEQGPGRDDSPQGSGEAWFYIFTKERSAGTQTLAGRLQAGSAVSALRKALGEFSGSRPPFTWWVIPASLVNASREEDFDSMYAPAAGKTFRMSTGFHTLTAMRTITETTQPFSPPSPEEELHGE